MDKATTENRGQFIVLFTLTKRVETYLNINLKKLKEQQTMYKGGKRMKIIKITGEIT